MKKKKLEAKLTKTKKKLAKARTELNAMLEIMEESGMPLASSKPAVGKKNGKAPAPGEEPAEKAAAAKTSGS